MGPADGAAEMKLVVAVLAADAEVTEQGLNIRGGAFEVWSLPAEPPVTSEMKLALVLELRRSDVGKPLDLQLRLSSSVEDRPPAKLRVETQVPTGFVAGAPILIPLVVGFPVEFHEVGPHELRVLRGAEELALIRFGVRVLTSG